jgi:hypothetical protein
MTDESKQKRGRRPIYSFPFNCEFCSHSIKERNSLRYHTEKYKYCIGSKAFEMSAVEKKIKAGEMAYPITTFNPTSGINTSVSKILEAIQSHIEKETKLAVKKGKNIQEYIEEGISVIFEDYSITDLNKVKNYLSERWLDFADKQDQVKVRLDDILDTCGMVVGQPIFEGLLGNPPNYSLCMEKLVVNHIRQRSMEELETSEGLIEAVFVAIKQTKIFRQAEGIMKEFKMIEEFLINYIDNSKETASSFLHSRGQLNSQQELPDDLTEYN